MRRSQLIPFALATATVVGLSACDKKDAVATDPSVTDDTTGLVTSPNGGGDDGSSDGSGGGVAVLTNTKTETKTSTATKTVASVTNPTLIVEGGKAIGTLHVKLADLGSLTGMDKIELRIAEGVIPAESCTSGAVALTVTSNFTNVELTLDTWMDKVYGFRACVYKGAELLGSGGNSGSSQDHHTIFVTSDSYTGDLVSPFYGSASFSTGQEGADSRCQYLANGAGKNGTWTALLSPTGMKPSDLGMYGKIYNNKPNPELVANNHTEFWSTDPFLADLNADEHGNAVIGKAWSGFQDQGFPTYSYCGQFTSNGSGASGTVGDPTTPGGNWANTTDSTCDVPQHLYCIDKLPGSLTIPPVATLNAVQGGAPGDMTVSIDVPDDVSHYGTVKIYALEGNPDEAQAPYQTCLNLGTYETLIRTLTKGGSPDVVDATFNHAAGSAGYYSYRACAFDSWGNFVSGVQKAAVLTGTDSFNRAFVLNQGSRKDGNMGGLAGADGFCQAAAASAGLTTTYPNWKALLSAPGMGNSAKERLTLTTKIYTVGSLSLYALNRDDIFTMNPRSGIMRHADGAFAGITDAWTGTNANGSSYVAPSDGTCQGWTSNIVGNVGHIGYADYAGTQNYFTSNQTCNTLKGLICLSSP